MTSQTEQTEQTEQILRLYRYADEDRQSAYVAAANRDFDDFNNLIACATTHENNAKRLERDYLALHRA